MKSMNKILIFDNVFNQNYTNIPNILKKILSYHKNARLHNLVKILKKRNNDAIIKVVSNKDKKAYFSKDIEIKLIQDFRLELIREEFLEIKKKVIEINKQNFNGFFENLRDLKTFQLSGVKLEKTIELSMKRFFNVHT